MCVACNGFVERRVIQGFERKSADKDAYRAYLVTEINE